MIIAIEGINGAGKSTVAKSLAADLGFEMARLPGEPSIPLCKEIRELLTTPMDKHTRFFLYMADMAEWYANYKGQNVILDRSFISTMVYQTADGVDESFVKTAIRHSGFFVDMLVLLTCDPQVAVERMSKRGTKTVGGFADREVEFYRDLQHRYIQAAEQYGDSLIIDTTHETPEQVVNIIKAYITQRL